MFFSHFLLPGNIHAMILGAGACCEHGTGMPCVVKSALSEMCFC